MNDHSLSITTTALLDGLQGEDAEAWYAFDQRYRPIVAGVLRRMGVAAAEVPDLVPGRARIVPARLSRR